MRIITGEMSGQMIDFPKGLSLRPTMDFAKEGLFNILNHRYDLTKFKVLELFAGSGSVSFEFISNQVRQVTAVDNNFKVINHLKSTAQKMNISNIDVVKSDVLKFLSQLWNTYDIIFGDPPYDYSHYQKIVSLVFERNLLNNNGLLILEHDRKVRFDQLENFQEERSYGKTAFSFFT